MKLHHERIARAYRLDRSMAVLLGLLVERPSLLTTDFGRKWRYKTDPKVVMWRLRNQLRGRGVKIQSKRFLGYWLEAKDKARIKKHVVAHARA